MLKPKFLTKEERQTEALRRRKDETEAIQQRNNELRRKRAKLLKEVDVGAIQHKQESSIFKADNERGEEAAVKERYLGIVEVRISIF